MKQPEVEIDEEKLQSRFGGSFGEKKTFKSSGQNKLGSLMSKM